MIFDTVNFANFLGRSGVCLSVDEQEFAEVLTVDDRDDTPGDNQSEPELLRSPEPNHDTGDEREIALTKAAGRRSRRKKFWRWVRRVCYVLMTLVLLGPVVAFVVTYQLVKVPSPQEVLNSQDQLGQITYADNSPMTKILSSGSHVLVRYQDIPEVVRQAVYAAEDRKFLSNNGFDLQGVARAALSHANGGGGGGSTIAQQYVKNATGNNQATLNRKFIELVTAAKMTATEPKGDVITAYLNIIYFGRGAYGIKDAATAYFNKPVSKLTISEAAMLGGIIQSPVGFDPSWNLPAIKERWNYVLDGMVLDGAISKATRDAQVFPNPLSYRQGTAAVQNSQEPFIVRQVLLELEKLGYPLNVINHEGLKITTTIIPKAQQAAHAAYQDVMVSTKQPDYLRGALVAVDARTGGVIAYEGGRTSIDYASTLAQPGSAFAPFVFAANLQQGGYLRATYDGSNNRTFYGRPTPVQNPNGAECQPTPKSCSVRSAMEQSINTVFYAMGLKVGTSAVQQAAYAAGIPKVVNGRPLLVGYNSNNEPDPNLSPDENIWLGSGNTYVRPLDMAYAYATFAAMGRRIGDAPHFVSEIVDNKGHIKYRYQPQPQQAFDLRIAGTVTASLSDVASWSSNHSGVIAKTGSQPSATSPDPNASSNAWTVGYNLTNADSVPWVSAAAWVGADTDIASKGNYVCPTCGPAGHNIYGPSEPAVMWQKFMDAYVGVNQMIFMAPPAPNSSAVVSPTPQRSRDAGPANEK